MPPKRSSDNKSDVVIVAFLGVTGSGLTNFVDRASGKREDPKEKNQGYDSRTKRITGVEVKHPKSNRRYILVDTPGFPVGGSSDEILGLLLRWKMKTFPSVTELSGVVYLHNIFNNRPRSLINNTSKLEGLCGKDFGKKVILAVTMEMKDREKAGRLTDGLKKETWKGMMDLGSNVVKFENTKDSAWEIIDRAVGENDEDRTLRPATITAGLRKVKSMGTMPTGSGPGVYMTDDENYTDGRYKSDQYLAQAKKPLYHRVVQWFASWF